MRNDWVRDFRAKHLFLNNSVRLNRLVFFKEFFYAKKSPMLFGSGFGTVFSSVADPNPDLDPPDPHVFGPPGSGSGSFYH